MSLPADHLIRKRQQREDTLADRRARAEFDAAEDRKIMWERRTEEMNKQRRVQNRFESLKSEEERRLQQRRNRLAGLLATEEQQQIQAVAATFETPEQQVERMRARAQELKNQREAERKAFVEEQLARKWRADADGLRHLESAVLIQHVKEERERDIALKREQKEKEKEEERKFAIAWEENRQAKIRREEEDKLRAKALTAEQYTVLNEQMQLRRQIQAEEAAVKQREKQALESLWERDARDREEQERRKQEDIQSRVQELDYFNKLSIARKERERKQEARMDRNILRNLIAQERDEEAEARARMLAAKEETHQYRAHLAMQRHKEQEDESILERMRAEQRDAEWEKKEAQWAKEANAREQLMSEVYAVREAQVGKRRREEDERRAEAERERQRLEAELELNKQLEESEFRAKKDAQARQKAALLAQMDKKRQRQEAEKFEADLAAREMLRAQEEYDRKLAQELEREITIEKHNRQRSTFAAGL